MPEPKQTPQEIRRLVESHKDHDERVYGVRPDFVFDTTPADADWIKAAGIPQEELDEAADEGG